MKNKFIISLLLSLLFVNTACEELDRDALYQDEFRKILYLKTNGVVNLTLYNTGEDVNYQLSVIKTGAYPELTADARLENMTDAELKAYCEPRGLKFKALSRKCFEISNTQFQFGPNEGYKLASLTLHTTTIDKESDLDPEGEYVIPMILKSDNDSISSKMNIIIIKPEIVTPAIIFTNMGLTENYCANGVTTIKVPLEFQIENKWDFTCKVEIDPTATDGNELLTKGYTLENNGVVKFTKGNRTAMLNVTINREDANLNDINFAMPVLPLRITSVSIPTFDVDTKAIQLGISSKYPLTSKMLSTNAQEPSEGSLANLLDDNINTFFHSAWSVSVDGKHYIQVDLPATLPSFRFSYTNRGSNGDASLAKFNISTSSDGKNFTNLKDYDKDIDQLPGEGAGVFKSGVLTPASPAKSIRITCIQSKNPSNSYFVWSEFSLYGF